MHVRKIVYCAYHNEIFKILFFLNPPNTVCQVLFYLNPRVTWDRFLTLLRYNVKFLVEKQDYQQNLTDYL